jgi:hypothetical protein
MGLEIFAKANKGFGVGEKRQLLITKAHTEQQSSNSVGAF